MAFGQELAQLRKDSGLTQAHVAADSPPDKRAGERPRTPQSPAVRGSSPASRQPAASALVAGFSVKTISDKERGIGSEAPSPEFVRLYVQRCRQYRRRDVPVERFDLALWERRRELLVDRLERASPGGVTEPAAAVDPPASSSLFRPLAEWTEESFGVQRPMALPGEARGGYSPYIGRHFDRTLREQVQEAHHSAPLCVTLSGWSSSGKTRSAWRALTSALPEDVPLARPDDAPALLRLLQLPVHPGAVIFLDDAAEHLGPAHLHEVVQALGELLGRPEPVLVLLTLDPATLGRLTELTDDPVQDRRIQRALSLVSRTVHEVYDELEDLAEAHGFAHEDPYLRHALAASASTRRVIPMLTGGPLLLERQPRLPPHTRALITAAGDCRRLGHTGPLPAHLLKTAALAHLDERQRARQDDDWLQAALTEAERPVRGDVRALHPVNTRAAYGVEGYEVSAYLVNHWVREADFIGVTVWQALHDHVTDGEQLVRLGHEAHSRAVYGWAHRYFTRAVSLGYAEAATALAWLLKEVAGRERLRVVASGDVAGQSGSGLAGGDDADNFMAAIDEALAQLEEIEGPLDPRLPGGGPGWAEEDFGLRAKDILERLGPNLAQLDVLGFPAEERGQLYSRMWGELDGVHGSKAPDGGFWLLPVRSRLTALFRALAEANMSARTALVWALENQPDADTTDNLREREQHLRALLAVGESPREVIRRLQKIAARESRWSDVDELTARGGRYELETAAALYERYGLHATAEKLNSELASVYAHQHALIEFWWRTGRWSQAEAALRRHIVAGNRHSLDRLITMLESTGREDEARAAARSGLEPDGSTSAWVPPGG